VIAAEQAVATRLWTVVFIMAMCIADLRNELDG